VELGLEFHCKPDQRAPLLVAASNIGPLERPRLLAVFRAAVSVRDPETRVVTSDTDDLRRFDNRLDVVAIRPTGIPAGGAVPERAPDRAADQRFADYLVVRRGFCAARMWPHGTDDGTRGRYC